MFICSFKGCNMSSVYHCPCGFTLCSRCQDDFKYACVDSNVYINSFHDGDKNGPCFACNKSTREKALNDIAPCHK